MPEAACAGKRSYREIVGERSRDRYQTGQELVNALERKKEETRAVVAPAVSRPVEVADAAAAPMEFLSAIENGAAPPPVKARTMAAAAGASGAAPAKVSLKPSLDEFVTPASNAGSRTLAAAAPGRAKPTKVPVDPAMAEEAPGKKSCQEFFRNRRIAANEGTLFARNFRNCANGHPPGGTADPNPRAGA